MTLAFLLLVAPPALAQPRLVVPEGVAVVVPPRGGDAPGVPPAPTPPRPALGWSVEDADFNRAASPNYLLLPLAAGAIAALATTLPGGGVAAGAPARTR